MKLILFDIDGTLLKAGGIVRYAMADAFNEVFGTSGAIMDTSFVGATDLGVVHELMGREGFSTAEINLRFPRLLKLYGIALEEKLSTWDKFQLCPGVPAILDKLQENGNLLGLVTGNCQVGAWIKLKRGRLAEYFRFGAFGDESSNRAEICRLAHERGEREAGCEIPKHSVILVGDAPSDIKAAADYGIRILVVASGWVPEEELRKLHPTWFYPDLSDADGIIQLLAD